jgi:hypothetical protein
MPEDIFISYSRKDSDRVMPLVQQLREVGYSVWLDDSHIESASLWAEQIVEGLKNCKVLMLMCSKDSLASNNVLKEVMLASELEKTLLPVYLEESELPSRFQYQLAGIQHIELFKLSDKQPVELVSDALDKVGVSKLGDEVRLADSTPIPKSGHKFILNKWKFIVSTIIGYIWITWSALGYYMNIGGNIFHLFIAAETAGVISITLGILLFSYRSSAFKPWFVPLGFNVPEEEVIIKKYISICKHSITIIIIAGFFGVISGSIFALLNLPTESSQSIVNNSGSILLGSEPLFDIERIAHMFGASLTSAVISLLLIMTIVLPTKLKLESLLTDRQVFEAEQREKQRRLDNLKKDWAKDFKKD